MTRTIMIGNHPVGDEQPVYIIAEIGINHNGEMGIVKRLIDVAAMAGCDAVKFQKRTPEKAVPPEYRDVHRRNCSEQGCFLCSATSIHSLET